MGKFCRVKQRTYVHKIRKGFNGNKCQVTEHVSNVDEDAVNTVNIESPDTVNNVNIESNSSVNNGIFK